MGLFDKAKEMLGGKSPEDAEYERKLCTHVKTLVEQSRSSANRIAHETIWMTNTAYCLGYDGVAFNATTRQFQPVNRSASYLKKSRIHVNKILPTLQNRAARLCKNPPKFEVRPEANDSESREAARLGQQIIGTMWDKGHLDEKRLQLIMWLQQCGHSWLKVSWDDQDGAPIIDPETGQLIDYEGDVRVDVCSPFEIFPDPVAKSQDDVLRTWIVQAKVRTLDYFRSHYPEKGDQVKEEDAWLLSVLYENRINSINSRGPSQGGMQAQMKNCAIELTKFEARSKEHPNGRLIITANGVLLRDDELPAGCIPFRKFDDIVIGGKFYSESVVSHLRPIQDQYNETIRRRAEWTRRLLAGKYIAARGGGLMQEALNDESGEIVYYDPVPNAPNAGMPVPLQTPMLPQWAYQETDAHERMINDISGISEVSRGTLPSASIPAIGMQLLTEQDDTRIGVMTEQHEHSWAGVASLILKYVEKYYITPRKLKIAGEGLQYAVKEVTGDMLKGHTDVVVVRGSTLPGSKTLKRQSIINAFQMGLMGEPSDPRVREKMLGLMEFGDIQGIWEDYGLDMQQIKKGIETLEAGDLPELSEFDNHALWIQELNRYRKNDKFLTLDPATQANFLKTMEAHVQLLMKVTNAAPEAPPPPPDMMAGAPQPGLEPDQGQLGG